MDEICWRSTISKFTPRETTMSRPSFPLLVMCITAFDVSSLGATATFTPTGPTSVSAGTDVTFQISVSSATGFNTADVLIGATGAANLNFVYSTAWMSAFTNVTPISYDNGFYDKDAFVGGNHATSVGNSLELGTITIDTTGMDIGTYSLKINHALDGISALGLSGTPDPILGIVTFSITRPVPAMSHWGVLIFAILTMVLSTLILRCRTPELISKLPAGQ